MKERKYTEANGRRRRILPEEVYANFAIFLKQGKQFRIGYHDCEDIMQAFAIKCGIGPGVWFDPEGGSVESYLHSVAHNSCVSFYRRHRNSPIVMEEGTMSALREAENTRECEHPLDRMVHEEILGLLHKGIEKLPRKKSSKLSHKAFVKYSVEGQDRSEVAKELGVRSDYVSLSATRNIDRLKPIMRRLIREDAA